jgi:hypothetical protein
MNDMIPCAKPEALIAYVYDECDLAERESIAAHVALCPTCSDEIRGLRDTRAHLGTWTPPSLPLGFQITRREDEASATVLRPAAFWKRPLPAWAQVAAAAVIFAAGMSVNAARTSTAVTAPAVQAPAPRQAPAAAPVADTQVTRAELAGLEARLRSIENADVQRVSPIPRSAVGSSDAEQIFARISAIEERVAETESQNTGRFATLIRALEANRRDIDASREATRRVNLMEEELQDHRQVLRTAWPSLAVRTSLQTGGR